MVREHGKKRWLKKIAATLAAALVIGMIPAQVANAAGDKQVRLAYQNAKSSKDSFSSFVLSEGQTVDLKFYGVSDYKKTGIGWKSSNKAVATVDKNGNVTAVGVGAATITYSAKGYTAGTAVVIVKAGKYSVSLAEQNTGKKLNGYNAKVGSSVDLKFVGAKGWNTKDYQTYWTSSDTEIATVDKYGVVTAVAPGTAQIMLTIIKKSTGKVAYAAEPVEFNVYAKNAAITEGTVARQTALVDGSLETVSHKGVAPTPTGVPYAATNTPVPTSSGTQPTATPGATKTPTPAATSAAVELGGKQLVPIEINKNSWAEAACGGVVIVREFYDGNIHYGAVDYEGKEIVPREYDCVGKYPNEKGYFVLCKWNPDYGEDGEGWYYPAVKTLFDKTGKALLTTESKDIVVSLDGYMTISAWVERGANWNLTTKTSYNLYSFDGSLNKSYDSDYAYVNDECPLSICTDFYDSKAILLRNVNLYDENGKSSWEFGFIDTKGKVTWQKATGTANNVETPLNSLNHGYFLTRGFFDSFLRLRNTNGIVNEFDWPGNSLDGEHFGRIAYFHFNGSKMYNYGSKIVLVNEEGSKYALVDLADGKVNYTIFDYCYLSDDKYWLIKKNGKNGYCDHDGNVIKTYDCAASFSNGYTLVVENGRAYLLNENFNKVRDLGDAVDVYVYEDLFRVYHENDVDSYIMK